MKNARYTELVHYKNLKVFHISMQM